MSECRVLFRDITDYMASCSDSSLMPYFIEFIKSEGTDNQEQAQLLKELKKIDEFLGKSEGNFFGGTVINALDLQIAPKLKHIIIGSKAAKVRPIRCRQMYCQRQKTAFSSIYSKGIEGLVPTLYLYESLLAE